MLMEKRRSPRRDRGSGRGEGGDEKHRNTGNDRPREKEKWERGEEGRRARPSKNPTRDHHRQHLEKLMEHPEKPVTIPELSRERKPRDPPEFVRFYMGSSAGAGSEVFHVYRHLRRRENDRQDYISARANEEKLEDEFQQTLATQRTEDNAKTAKKRAKRLKRKQRQKLAKKQGKGEGVGDASVGDASVQCEKPEEENSSEPEAEEAHFVIGGK